jgi:hypothetical protein
MELEARKNGGGDTRARLESQMNERQTPIVGQKNESPASAKTTSGGSGKFVFSLRPELTVGTSVMGAGISVEFGAIGKKGLYFTGELNGGSVFGGGLNIGGCFNKDGNVKNVLGFSVGYRNALHFVDLTRNNVVEQSAVGTNIGIAGAFWELMFGRNKNFNVTNKVLLGLRKNPVDYDWIGGSFIYEEGINVAYILGIGYTLTKEKK